MSTTNNEMVQTKALWLTKSEADRLIKRTFGCSTFITYGIEVYTVDAEPMPVINPVDGTVTKTPAVNLMVRAETEMQAGIGKGFLIALSEGISK